MPNLLRAPKAIPYDQVLDNLKRVREVFAGKEVHVFGIGGTATLHLAMLLRFDSVDSSGWRNRAARGIVQLPGSGDRITAELGKWRGRRPSPEERETLSQCACPSCLQQGLDGLKADGMDGFCSRATHNLWILLQEVGMVEKHLAEGTYRKWYKEHMDNSICRPLIERIVGI